MCFRCFRSKTSNTCEGHRGKGKVGAEDWPVQNFESKDSTIVNCQIHKTVFKWRFHPMKVTTTTSIIKPSLFDPTNVSNCLKQVPQSQRNHGRMDQLNHGKVIGIFTGCNFTMICGTHQRTTVADGNLRSGEMPIVQVAANSKHVRNMESEQISAKSMPVRGLRLLKRKKPMDQRR